MNPEENVIQKNESAGSASLPCSVVKDLLPLYVDGAVSSETGQMIPDTVTSVYYLSEEGWKLYRGETLSPDQSSEEAKEVSEKIEASSTKLAER